MSSIEVEYPQASIPTTHTAALELSEVQVSVSNSTDSDTPHHTY